MASSSLTSRLTIGGTWDGQPCAAGERVGLVLTESPDGLTVEVDAPDHGDAPPPAPPGPTEGLWDFEVVELFVCGPEQRYLEVELGPRGHHLVLTLEGVRRPTARLLPLDYRVVRTAGRWRGTARVPAALLPARPWTVNAYALHGTGAARRYLSAYPVPGDRPDFHRLQFFRPFPSSGTA